MVVVIQVYNFGSEIHYVSDEIESMRNEKLEQISKILFDGKLNYLDVKEILDSAMNTAEKIANTNLLFYK